MSKIALSGDASGTGTLTIAAPNTSTDRTLTLPDESGTVLTSGGAIDVNASAPADSVAIDSSGNVGIGTTSPAKPLHVSGGSSGGTFPTDTILAIEDNDGTTLSLLGGTSSILGITLGDSADNDRFKIECNTTSGSRYMAFTVDASERARIDSSGRLLVGATATFGGADAKINAAANGSAGQCFAANNTDTGSGSQYVFPFYRNGSLTGGITNTNTATGFATSSDYRLKENIAPMTGALTKVLELNPVTYTWKIDGAAGQGFIAHELQAVVPDCVTGEKDAVDPDGNPIYQGVDTSFLVATLTAAIQELKAINDAQASRIETLEAKVAALEAL